MGRSHRNNETFPRIAWPIGYVDKDILYAVSDRLHKGITAEETTENGQVGISRPDWGVEKFTSVTEQYFGKKFQRNCRLRSLSSNRTWMERPRRRKLWYGVHVQNGRLRTTWRKLRLVIERYELPVRLTAQQDLLLCGVDPKWKMTFTKLWKTLVWKIWTTSSRTINYLRVQPCLVWLSHYRSWGVYLTSTRDLARSWKPSAWRIRWHNDSLTGCPNGCARHYMKLNSVSLRRPNSYQIWLGGTET